jgi:hypothetical protein
MSFFIGHAHGHYWQGLMEYVVNRLKRGLTVRSPDIGKRLAGSELFSESPSELFHSLPQFVLDVELFFDRSAGLPGYLISADGNALAFGDLPTQFSGETCGNLFAGKGRASLHAYKGLPCGPLAELCPFFVSIRAYEFLQSAHQRLGSRPSRLGRLKGKLGGAKGGVDRVDASSYGEIRIAAEVRGDSFAG